MRILAAALLSLTLAQAAAVKRTTVDINRARMDELKALKRIGDVRAAAIVNRRPYARKDELVRKGTVSQAVFDEIRGQIVARQ